MSAEDVRREVDRSPHLSAWVCLRCGDWWMVCDCPRPTILERSEDLVEAPQPDGDAGS